MARPEEKAQAMMNKWVAMREAGNRPAIGGGGGSSSSSRRHIPKRPALASSVEHLADAEYYRGQLVREVSQLITKIQNPGLGEHTIRDINDTINKKLREKYHWNVRVYQLGGLDYNTIEKQRQVEEGDVQAALVGAGGYRYFGAAKDLPGVQEFFTRQAQRYETQTMKRNLYHTNMNGDYFGWREEEDGVLLEMEDSSMMKTRTMMMANTSKHQDHYQEEHNNNNHHHYDMLPMDHEELYELLTTNVPTQAQVAQLLFEEKKRQLLEKLK